LMMQTGPSNLGLVLQIGGLLALIFFGAFYIFPHVLPFVATKIPKLGRIEFLQKMATEFVTLRRSPFKLIGVFILSLCVQAAFVGMFILFARAVGVEVGPGVWFFAWPIAKILAVLPISLGGIGVREATLAGLIAPLGAPAAGVVVTSLVWQAVLIVTGLLGALIWYFGGNDNLDRSDIVESK